MYSEVNKLYLLTKKSVKLKPNLKYSIRFASIIAPSSVPSFSLLNHLYTPINYSKNINNKLHIKQSYLLMTWMSYVKDNYSELHDLNFKNSNKKPSIFVFPKTTKKFTNTKAPMAHKTFSQEQFKFSFYFMSASFNVNNMNYISDIPNSVNKSLYVILYLKTNNNISSSNLFLLKRFTFFIESLDTNYLNYNTWLSN